MTPSMSSKRVRIAAESEVSDYVYNQGWSDGLPVVAPTRERVGEFLAHAGLEPGQPIAHYEVRNRTISAEKVAINAVMAGCKAEYLPVIVAAMEAVTDHAFHLNHIASTSSPWPLFVVNGPIIDALGLNDGAGVMGPGHHANATIGRAISLTLANCLDARVGGVQQGVLGIPSRMGGGVIAEQIDSGWQPLSESLGVAAGTSAITAIPHFMGGPQEIIAHPAEYFPGAPALASFIGEHFAEYNSAGIGGTHLVLISPSMQRRFKAAGWSKENLREYLLENARISFAKLMRRPGPGGLWPSDALDAPDGSLAVKPDDYQKYWYLGQPEKGDTMPPVNESNSRNMTNRPSDFLIAVAGAADGPMLACLGRCYPLLPVSATKIIRSPLCP